MRLRKRDEDSSCSTLQIFFSFSGAAAWTGCVGVAGLATGSVAASSAAAKSSMQLSFVTQGDQLTIAGRRGLVKIAQRPSFVRLGRICDRSVTLSRRADQRPDDTADRLNLARRPAGLGEDRTQRVFRCRCARRRMEIAFGFQFFINLTD